MKKNVDGFIPVAIDCLEYYFNGYRLDGVYYIRPRGIEFDVPVYCELMDGGWTRIQRRDEGLVNFNLNWEGTKQGFGNVSGEHWLGILLRLFFSLYYVQ